MERARLETFDVWVVERMDSASTPIGQPKKMEHV